MVIDRKQLAKKLTQSRNNLRKFSINQNQQHMRILLLAGVVLATTPLFAQTTSPKILFGAAVVKPKEGQKLAFESAWTAHLKKFHDGKSSRAVFEIYSGDHTGELQLVEGPMGYADLDVDMPNTKAHDMDFESTVASKLAWEKEGYTYKFIDSLSGTSDFITDKGIQTTYHIKPDKLEAFLKEVRRSVVINQKINSPVQYASYLEMFAGSEPELVIRRPLKNGFKELEPGFFPPTTEAFKKAYIEAYGQADYDLRSSPGGIYTMINSYEQFLVKFRKDLSTAAAPTK